MNQENQLAKRTTTIVEEFGETGVVTAQIAKPNSNETNVYVAENREETKSEYKFLGIPEWTGIIGVILMLLFWVFPSPTNLFAWLPKLVGSTPEQAIVSYWNNVSNKNFQAAWQSLSPGFQQREHDNDYNAYVKDYEWMKSCSVKATDVDLVDISDTSTKVTAYVIYEGARCSYKRTFDHLLLFDASTKVWLLDRVVDPQK
jgi:hypothetical protein